jgi:hypothetical protein
VAAAGGQHLGRPEASVGPQRQLAVGAGAVDAPGEFVDEPLRATTGGGPAGAPAGVQHLAGVSPGGQQRVVAELAGGAVGGAALVVAVDLADGGVQVDGHGPIARAGAGRPRPAHEGLGHAVELADVAEGEAAQERPERRRGHHAVAEHGRGGPGTQQLGVVDAVGSGDDRVQQGQHLAARLVGTGTAAEVDQPIGDRLDPQALSQRGGQQQRPGVGDRVVVVERDNKPGGAVGGWHRERALQRGMEGRLSNAILPAQRAFLGIKPPPRQSATVDPGSVVR